jgi:hypothetical protein
LQEVLFQTEAPTAAGGRVEFYDLCLLHEKHDGRTIALVRESHGWWDNELKSAIFEEEATLLSSTFGHYHDAVDHYWRRRLYHARRDYVHSFMWHPITGVPAFYKRLEAI